MLSTSNTEKAAGGTKINLYKVLTKIVMLLRILMKFIIRNGWWLHDQSAAAKN
jgi:hypothetical protein